MKKLTLIRHAKSSWEFNVIDHERPLNKRGLNDASLVSNYLKKENLEVDTLICSDAVRTKTTADIFISELNIDLDIVSYSHDLYDFEGSLLTKEIKSCNHSINNLMVFGHNHAITSFVNSFGNQYIENVPTCGVTIIEFDIDDWNELNQGATVKTIFPRDLK